ncbi:ferritin-like domain-containing protein [Chitinophaga sp. 30R24]|uniref:ferritin-like domain-containing protein n=1 Tax=Chitinophaga sp. 30R24 TaxID=3248838 RepID=UPI003B8FF0C5
MCSSKKWLTHFTQNAGIERINWLTAPVLTTAEKNTILNSLQAWQLAETSDGIHLIRVATMYAARQKAPDYVPAIRLFIKEEQKHGNNLGRYLDIIGEKRITKNWGDILFRKTRYFNTSMEMWTITVLVVESTAQLFYQSLKEATNCPLLQQICTDILIDEAWHIRFQSERLQVLLQEKSRAMRIIAVGMYTVFYFLTAAVVWWAHRKVFKAGRNHFSSYMQKMKFKYFRLFHGSLAVTGPLKAITV